MSGDMWIIVDGEKLGPYSDFDIRKKIDAKELDASTPAWRAGMPKWINLSEIDTFSREFESPPGSDEA